MPPRSLPVVMIRRNKSAPVYPPFLFLVVSCLSYLGLSNCWESCLDMMVFGYNGL